LLLIAPVQHPMKINLSVTAKSRNADLKCSKKLEAKTEM